MSRFADKLKSALQVAPPAMGFFRAAQAAAKPKMLLVAWADADAVEKTPGLLEGADAAVLVSAKTPAVKTLKAVVKSLGDAPLGVWAGDASGFKSLDANGVDFVVFDPEKMPLAASSEKKPGLVAGIPFDLADSLIRAVNELPVDAVIVNSPGTPLTFQDLMRFRRLGDFVAKPMLGVVPASASADEIKALWDAGLDALVVSLTAENADAFKSLKKTLGTLDLAAKRKWMKSRAIVPAMPVEHEHEEESEPEPGEPE